LLGQLQRFGYGRQQQPLQGQQLEGVCPGQAPAAGRLGSGRGDQAWQVEGWALTSAFPPGKELSGALRSEAEPEASPPACDGRPRCR
jgi:hypothetical protein